MATSKVPNSNGQIRQSNKGDVYGELWGSFNIDLTSSPGKIKTSRQLYTTLSEAKMDNDDLLASVVYNGWLYNILSGDRWQYLQAYRNPRISGTWTSSSGSSMPTSNATDAIVFNGQLLVSGSTNIAMNNNAGTPTWDNDWWTTIVSGTALTSNVPHVMDVSNIGAETLFVTDGNKVRYYNASAGHSTVTLAADQVACCLATDYKATFAGTYSNSGNARVYEIYIGETLSGTPVARNSYEVDGTAVLSMDVIEGVVYIVTDRGHIQAFNGVAFVTVGSFPFAFDSVAIDGMSVGDIAPTNIDRGIHPKGMRAYGKSLLININTNNQLIDDLAANPIDNDDIFNNVVVNERSPSGVWEFDTETRVLNHRYAFKYDTTQKGFHRLQKSAPILVLDNQYTRIITGGRLISTRTDIFMENPDQVPTGYIITSEIDSGTVQDAWEHLALKIESLAEGESIEVKYRTSKVKGYPAYASGAFANASIFNTTDDLSMVSVGDEIELVDGTHAGQMAHVASISKSSSTYTVVLDTAIAAIGVTCYARFQNWKKATIEDLGQIIKLGVSEVSTWVQFKIVMTGNIEMRGLINKGTAKSEL